MHKKKIYDHGLSPLLIQNPYSKFSLAEKMLFDDRFSNFFACPIATKCDPDADKKIFLCPPTIKNSPQKLSIRRQTLHSSAEFNPTIRIFFFFEKNFFELSDFKIFLFICFSKVLTIIYRQNIYVRFISEIGYILDKSMWL